MEANLGAEPPLGPSKSSATSTVEVRPLAGRRDRNRFVTFPWRIYAHDPHWVPPLLLERKSFIHPGHHPFYRHGQAVQLLAWRQGEVVGRIMASDDPNYNREHQTNLGCFGMFESIADPQVAHALLDAAANWLRQRGRDRMMGPIDYSTNYACGLLVEGFDKPPRVMMNHNPAFYLGLLESWGLVKAKDLYSWWFDDPYRMLDVWRPRAQRLAARGGVKVRSLRVEDLAAEVMRCKQVYNAAWERNWGFVKMTDAEFEHLAKNLVQLALPELLLLAEVEGEPVGFSMTLPDFNEAMRPLNGRVFKWGLPIGWFQFRRNCRRIKTARMLTLGILEKYRRRGIAELLILETLQYGLNSAGFTAAELSWTLEDNNLINAAIDTVGGKRYKTYRIFEKSLAP